MRVPDDATCHEGNGLRIAPGPGAAPAQRAAPDDPELAALVAAWPTLPEAIRAGILAMVRAAGGHPL
jgi:hypothetical protein